MSINWNLYNRRLSINGTSQRERDLNNYKRELLNNFESSLSCKTVEINGITQKIMVIETSTKNKKQIISPISNQLQNGDYVLLNNNHYMITDIDLDDEIHIKGDIQLCNYILKFQHPLTKEVLSYHCISQRTSGSGVENGKTLMLPDNQKTVLIQCDNVTIQFTNGTRFFLDNNSQSPTPYKITYVDNVSNVYNGKGYVTLYLDADTISKDTDRIDLGVCDYKEVDKNSVIKEGVSYSNIACGNSNNELTLGGGYRTLVATFYDSNNNIIDVANPIWEFYRPIGYENSFTFLQDGNIAKVKVVEDYSLLDKEITISVFDVNYSSKGEIKLTIIL